MFRRVNTVLFLRFLSKSVFSFFNIVDKEKLPQKMGVFQCPYYTGFHSFANVNHSFETTNYIRRRTSQDVSRPLRTFVLGGF